MKPLLRSTSEEDLFPTPKTDAPMSAGSSFSVRDNAPVPFHLLFTQLPGTQKPDSGSFSLFSLLSLARLYYYVPSQAFDGVED
ncbi:hypothetical protein STEG23_014351 [Scotinomys teguina]